MRHMCKVVLDDTHMRDDEWVVMQVLLQGNKQAVIERASDLPTPEDFRKFPKEVAAAILEELRI